MNGKRAKALRKFALKHYNPIKNKNIMCQDPWKNWVRWCKTKYQEEVYKC